MNEVHSLCGVLELDFGQTVGDVHPSLHGTDVEQSTNISNSTLEGLGHTILKLKTERKARIQKVMYIHHCYSSNINFSFSPSISIFFLFSFYIFEF